MLIIGVYQKQQMTGIHLLKVFPIQALHDTLYTKENAEWWIMQFYIVKANDPNQADYSLKPNEQKEWTKQKPVHSQS